MNLYTHQKRFLEKDIDRCLLSWDTGTGKTRGCIEWTKQKGRTHLIICPKSIVYKWVQDIKTWSSGESVVTEINDKNYEIDTEEGYIYRVLSKEQFKKIHKELEEFVTITVDEAHFFAGMKSALSKSLISYIKKYNINKKLLMTATPYTSSPWSIYRLAEILGYNISYWEFRNKFFRDQYFGKRSVPVPIDGIEDDMANLVKKIGDVVAIEECNDIPEQTFEVEYFNLNKKQEKLIEETYDPNPIVKFTKHHQIESGSLKGDEYTDNKIIDCDKYERIIDLVNSNKKIAIVARYNLQIDHLKKMIENKTDRVVHVINGKTKDKKGVVEAVEEGDKACVLINASCAEGYELPSVPTMVFFSLGFSYVHYKQICGRILRLNKLKKNTYIHLITKSGVDEAVYDSVKKKEDFSLAIYAESIDNKDM